jgi:rhodanese-related sulfurtransferase
MLPFPVRGHIRSSEPDGVRSRQVGAFLRQSGFARVINLTGGIDAWSADVDPDVIVY